MKAIKEMSYEEFVRLASTKQPLSKEMQTQMDLQKPINWDSVSTCQPLKEELQEELKLIDWNSISTYQPLRKEIKEEIKPIHQYLYFYFSSLLNKMFGK